MKSAIFAASAGAAAAMNVSEEFTNFMIKFNKVYETSELAQRVATFEANLKFIEEHNASGATFKVGINQFADMTNEEFSSKFLGYKRKHPKNLEARAARTLTTTAAIDWEAQGMVTSVKDQGQCGSCWAFSTTGGVESATAIATGKLPYLSEQELVDCAKLRYGNLGCNGGLMDGGFDYIIANGVTTEAAYPYTAKDGTCKTNLSDKTFISSYHDLRHLESALGDDLVKGPISIAIEADQLSFQLYSSGVFQGPCGKNLDHGVLLVGSGTESGLDFWKVKNSWGKSWGEQGYIKIQQGADYCGIGDEPSRAIH